MMPKSLRYSRSPEFVLAVANAAVLIPLSAFELLDSVVEYLFDLVLPIASSLFSPPWDDWFVIGAYLLATAPLLFPLSSAVLAAAIAEIVDIQSWHPTFTYLSIPNAIIWGFLVAFAYRIVKTGDIRRSIAATLLWRTGIDLPALEPCPHCGRPMPRKTK